MFSTIAGQARAMSPARMLARSSKETAAGPFPNTHSGRCARSQLIPFKSTSRFVYYTIFPSPCQLQTEIVD